MLGSALSNLRLGEAGQVLGRDHPERGRGRDRSPQKGKAPGHLGSQDTV